MAGTLHNFPSIQTIPDDILIEIFKWIPFDDLHYKVMPVCRSWRALITTHYRYPRILLIRDPSKIGRIRYLTSTYSHKIRVLKVKDAFGHSVMTCLKDQQWPVLRTLVIQSSWTNVDRAVINVSDLNCVIDGCPKLCYLKINESLVNGNLELLFEKIKRRKITKFALLNRYFVIDDTERMYDLKNMEVFNVYCPFFNRDSMSRTLDNFLANNRRSLVHFAFYGQTAAELPNGDDDIMAKIASCTQLIKLSLAGELNISLRGLEQVTILPRLRCFKIDVSPSLPSNILAQFLSHQCIQKLHSLKVRWYRPVDLSEMESLKCCSRCLSKLSLEFWTDNNMAVLEPLAELTKKSRELSKLKLLSSDINFLSVLSSLTRQRGNLVQLKFLLAFYVFGGQPTGHRRIKEYLDSIASSDFNYERSWSETDFRITLLRRR